MNSGFFKLNAKDLAKGLVVAVVAAGASYLADAFNVPGFDLATFDWTELARVAILSGGAYLLKNLLSEDGKLFGKI